MILCIAGFPLGFFFASVAAGEGSVVALVRCLAALPGGVILGFLVSKFGFRTYRYAVKEVRALAKEELRTGQAIFPDDLAKRWGIRRYSLPPQVSEQSLRRMRFARRMERGKWVYILSVAALLGFAVPFEVSVSLGVRGLVPVTVIGVLSFGPIAIMLALAAKVGDGVALLLELREYEQATGRRALPDDLSSAGEPRTR